MAASVQTIDLASIASPSDVSKGVPYIGARTVILSAPFDATDYTDDLDEGSTIDLFDLPAGTLVHYGWIVIPTDGKEDTATTTIAIGKTDAPQQDVDAHFTAEVVTSDGILMPIAASILPVYYPAATTITALTAVADVTDLVCTFYLLVTLPS